MPAARTFWRRFCASVKSGGRRSGSMSVSSTALVSHAAGLARADHEGRVVGAVVAVDEIEPVATEEHAPDRFYLELAEGHADAAVLAAAEADEGVARLL